MRAKASAAAAAAGIGELAAEDVARGLALRVSDLGLRLPMGRGTARLWGQHHWALRGINIEVMRGESIAILGRNGSGKSTLLRAIAGIIAANEGRISIAPGLTAAILSPGAGFENNLTGRENLINSALYQGFLPKVVRAKMDEIVELSGIGDWVDQPVAIYSAGMRARLGLSLALHLPTDVLMIDESLSAGDAAFRAKAEVMIDELISSDRTVILVSHNLETLRTMCTRGVVLDRGRQIAACGIDEAIQISKAILLDTATMSVPGNKGLSQRDAILAQLEAVHTAIADWHKRAEEHGQIFRKTSQAYQLTLEQLVQIADKLAAAREPAAEAGTARFAGGVEVKSEVDAIVAKYQEARQQVKAKRAERDAARDEQERITKKGQELHAQLAALNDKLAGL